MASLTERNQDATVYVGGLDEKVTEHLLAELFIQVGPVVNCHMPKDRVTQTHQGYGFVEFLSEDDADYAIKILNMIKLFGKPVRVNKASSHQKNLDVGANLFIGNLDPEIDEKLLYDTFSAFGVILQTPKIMRDPDTGNSKGFAFINYSSFEAADAALEAMNGQYLCNRPITISFAFKKDGKGERHGSAAERLLAAQNPMATNDRPHTMFADGVGGHAPPNMGGGGMPAPMGGGQPVGMFPPQQGGMQQVPPWMMGQRMPGARAPTPMGAPMGGPGMGMRPPMPGFAPPPRPPSYNPVPGITNQSGAF